MNQADGASGHEGQQPRGDILLATLNARYIHSAFGLRYLRANMGPLRPRTEIHEFTLERPIAEVAERLLLHRPRIIGLGVYIWNAEPIGRLVRLLKRVAPEVVLVLGGPEVSHEWQQQPMVAMADYLITGQADLAFADLCGRVLAGAPPAERVIQAGEAPLQRLTLPYDEYSDADLAHRIVYVEASRGCPFRCAFCLSALDKTARGFDSERMLSALDRLYRRGARQFKFVDRTFNLKPGLSGAILDFFIDRMAPDLFVHFEVIPDHLPDALKQRLSRFPPGSLQLEIGVQTFNPEVQQRISRRQDPRRTLENLAWLRQNTGAHLHTDLIIGLPGEDMASFAQGFDLLWSLGPQEIQVGVLKRLRGTPIVRHDAAFDMRYSLDPPYQILSTRDLDFASLQRLKRFARYWDLIGNSGRFSHSLPLLLGEQPFQRFLAFSDWLYAATDQTSQLALKRLYQLLWRYLRSGEDGGLRTAIEADFAASASKGRLLLEGEGQQQLDVTCLDSRNRRQRRHGQAG